MLQLQDQRKSQIFRFLTTRSCRFFFGSLAYHWDVFERPWPPSSTIWKKRSWTKMHQKKHIWHTYITKENRMKNNLGLYPSEFWKNNLILEFLKAPPNSIWESHNVFSSAISHHGTPKALCSNDALATHARTIVNHLLCRTPTNLTKKKPAHSLVSVKNTPLNPIKS